MEVPPIAGASQGGSVQAQVQLQKKSENQQEAVTSKILESTEESAAKIAATGKRTIAVA